MTYGAGEPAAGGASSYDEFVDWERRLGREGPFFRELFARESLRRVVDVGSGSGRHAVLFAGWGLEVVGVDPDEGMLAAAREHARAHEAEIAEAGGSVRFLQGGFGELARLGVGPADAVTCTGNALPHVAGHAGLRTALSDFASVLRPGGVLVLHLLNHARLLATRPRAVPPVVRDTPEGLRVFLRVVGYPEGGEFLDFDFVTLTRDAAGAWDVSDRRSPHTALPAPLLAEGLARAGFGEPAFLGDHTGKAFDADADESVIVTARRG